MDVILEGNPNFGDCLVNVVPLDESPIPARQFVEPSADFCVKFSRLTIRPRLYPTFALFKERSAQIPISRRLLCGHGGLCLSSESPLERKHYAACSSAGHVFDFVSHGIEGA